VTPCCDQQRVSAVMMNFFLNGNRTKEVQGGYSAEWSSGTQ
jgi:hypothetical protein